MKKVILILLILISVFCNAQSKRAPINIDSLKRVQDSVLAIQQKVFVDSIELRAPMRDFLYWLYENMKAKQHDDFMNLYQQYIQEKYTEFTKPKR